MGTCNNNSQRYYYIVIGIIFFTCALVMGLLSFLILTTTAAGFSPPDNELIECEIRTIFADDEINGDSVSYECVVVVTGERGEDMVYDLPPWFVDEYAVELESPQNSYVTISKGRIVQSSRTTTLGLRSTNRDDELGDSIFIAADSEFVFHDEEDSLLSNERHHHRRQLARPNKKGVNTALIVYVTALDSQPTLSANTISERFFGSEEESVASAFKSCSFGGLEIEPATGDLITNGVVELQLDIAVRGVKVSSLENTMTEALTGLIGPLDAYQHLVYCMPPGTKSRHGAATWSGGYAHVGVPKSVHNDKACGYMDPLVHELSHNLGLGHASEGRNAYGDTSGRMGGSYSRVGYPIKCFNGAMTAQLGWYDGKKEVLDLSSGAWRGNLYGFTDYDSPAATTVQLQIGDLFVQYNKAVGINRETSERKNQITVTQSTLAHASSSYAKGSLRNIGSELVIESFNGSSNEIIIEICATSDTTGTPDFFDMSIRLSTQGSRCNDPTPPPTTQSPSQGPSQSSMPPSTAPTSASSALPSVVPSSAPSSMPTTVPTLGPSASMTPSTTLVPSSVPSDVPTTLPTSGPSTSMQPSTTLMPSTLPSGMPTTSHSPSSSSMPSPSLLAVIIEGPTTSPSCVDNDSGGNFFAPGMCTMLNENPERIPQLCHFAFPTYWLCPKTCGNCP